MLPVFTIDVIPLKVTVCAPACGAIAMKTNASKASVANQKR